ncbi:c-type cytochrome [Notoacmeibacter ruber]|uniref:Cytochrome c family protein n=1 Tax=Notoacmeibacter ruber TaxID=2670375 RepID=A0A3L7J9E4_9HYPH|nr:cytochrome c family protein [Notoacmeibacter ruber]RLQ87044.1 cytochrome c family protein [Notoacmeibacter ruber]
MDSFELNKIVGGLLAAVFVVFSIGLISDAIFHEEVPEQAGYTIEAAEEGAGGGAAAEEEPAVSIGELMASADASAGEAVFKKCASCHTIEDGGANKVGPNLHGVIGRAIASHEGFSYSEAMQSYAGEVGDWDFEHMNAFLLRPKDEVPGTAMGFAGLKKDSDRANLLAWLNEQSANPQPLPEPEAAPAEGDTADAPPPEGVAGEDEAQPQAEGAGPAEGTGDPAGAVPAEDTTEAAPSSESGDMGAAPTAVEGTGEALSADDEAADTDANSADPDQTDAAGTDAEQPEAEGSDTATEAETTTTDGEASPEEEILPEESN